MNNTWPKVAIIILNWNGWRDTIGCLESLQKIDYPDYLIIVVDNASSDGSVEKIKSWATGKVRVVEYEGGVAEQGGIKELEEELQEYPNDKKIVLIKNNANLGYSGGNNVGIRYALRKKAVAILIINPDILIMDGNTIKKLVNVLFSSNRVYVFGPRIIGLNGEDQSPLRQPNFGEEIFRMIICPFKKLNYVIKITNNSTPLPVERIPGCL